jgi:predicted short-subunit dehydrogenase-like oxidoreductase (DUF2520 family)
LQQTVENALRCEGANFTGALARGDWAVVREHLQALRSRPELEHAYQGYLRLAHELDHPVPKEFL